MRQLLQSLAEYFWKMTSPIYGILSGHYVKVATTLVTLVSIFVSVEQYALQLMTQAWDWQSKMAAVSSTGGVMDPGRVEALWPTISPYLELVNYVLPVGETINAICQLSLLWVVCTGYRFIKSWIPTVS